jgi:hypothetical protein
MMIGTAMSESSSLLLVGVGVGVCVTLGALVVVDGEELVVVAAAVPVTR